MSKFIVLIVRYVHQGISKENLLVIVVLGKGKSDLELLKCRNCAVKGTERLCVMREGGRMMKILREA